jgi:hypothetical protein
MAEMGEVATVQVIQRVFFEKELNPDAIDLHAVP